MIERAKVGITDSGQFVYAVKDAEGNVVPVRKDQIYMKEYTDSKFLETSYGQIKWI